MPSPSERSFTPPVDAREDRTLWWLALAAIAAAGLAIGALYLWRARPPEPPVAAPVVAAPAPAGPAAPAEPAAAPAAPVYPIEQTQAQVNERPTAALPAVDASDSALVAAVATLLGPGTIKEFIQPEGLARRIVATLDNLPRAKLAARVLPLRPVPGRFATAGSGGALVIGGDNPARYTPLVRLFEATDTRRLVGLYVRFYPLLQQAYKDLGYPGKSLNDRVVEVIDHLLATPEPPLPVQLVQPKVLYEFADPELEARSAGQKILMRMGPDHATSVKAKLRDVRRAIVGR